MSDLTKEDVIKIIRASELPDQYGSIDIVEERLIENITKFIEAREAIDDLQEGCHRHRKLVEDLTKERDVWVAWCKFVLLASNTTDKLDLLDGPALRKLACEEIDKTTITLRARVGELEQILCTQGPMMVNTIGELESQLSALTQAHQQAVKELGQLNAANYMWMTTHKELEANYNAVCEQLDPLRQRSEQLEVMTADRDRRLKQLEEHDELIGQCGDQIADLKAQLQQAVEALKEYAEAKHDFDFHRLDQDCDPTAKARFTRLVTAEDTLKTLAFLATHKEKG